MDGDDVMQFDWRWVECNVCMKSGVDIMRYLFGIYGWKILFRVFAMWWGSVIL